MNDPRRLRRREPLLDGPRARLLLAGGEVRLQLELLVRGADQRLQTALVRAQVGEELVPLLRV